MKPLVVLASQLTGSGMPKVRFVKSEISHGNEWLYLDEVVVNPVRTPAKE
jgi:hypothetical protein